jgi:hypothetical protein
MERFPPPPSGVLLGAVEPQPFEELVGEQGGDGVDSGPISEAL